VNVSTTARIPITRPAIDASEVDAVVAVLRSGMLVQGEHVARFEEAIAASAGTRHAVALSNCTVALELALRAMGIGTGDVVLVTPYSWVATVNAIELVGATPIFADIDPETFNLSAESIRRRLDAMPAAERARVRAILPVHTFGNLAGIEEISVLASELALLLLEDAACAIGATSAAGSAGGIGVAGCFSFHPRKIVTTGEGGAITTDDDDIAAYARAFRNHGQSDGSFTSCGSNLRMTDFQGAMGVAQMAKLGWMVSERTRLAERYDDVLTGCGLMPQRRGVGSVVQSYVALVPEDLAAKSLVEQLRAMGVEATIGTTAIPFTPYHSAKYPTPAGSLPALCDVDRRAITLPLFPAMTEQQQDAVVAAIRDAL
jgi:perosamine synthetase